jgi:hypothetical protein
VAYARSNALANVMQVCVCTNVDLQNSIIARTRQLTGKQQTHLSDLCTAFNQTLGSCEFSGNSNLFQMCCATALCLPTSIDQCKKKRKKFKEKCTKMKEKKKKLEEEIQSPHKCVALEPQRLLHILSSNESGPILRGSPIYANTHQDADIAM